MRRRGSGWEETKAQILGTIEKAQHRNSGDVDMDSQSGGQGDSDLDAANEGSNKGAGVKSASGEGKGVQENGSRQRESGRSQVKDEGRQKGEVSRDGCHDNEFDDQSRKERKAGDGDLNMEESASGKYQTSGGYVDSYSRARGSRDRDYHRRGQDQRWRDESEQRSGQGRERGRRDEEDDGLEYESDDDSRERTR